ncbi:MAG: SDR family oxidoreductase [Mesorhizobium sp.]
MLLSGKTAVVYGGGAIGGAVATTFAREGARVFLGGRTQDKIEAVADAIRKAGGRAEADQVDALDEAAVTRHVRTVAERAGQIDILFNAIGTEDIQGTPLVEMPVADFVQPIHKAAATQFITAKAVALHMMQYGSGVIMTITAGPPEAVREIGGFGPACQMIEGLWRGLAAELAPHGIRAVCLRSAGSPDSPDFQEMVRQHVAVSGISREDYLTQLSGGTLQKRLPLLAEVAEVAAMMASDRASAMTGTFVHVTCGSPGG